MRIQKIHYSILFLFGFHCSLISQSMVEGRGLDSLYLRALKLRVDLLLSSGYKYFEINKNTDRIKEQSISSNYIFVTTEDLIKLSKNKKEGIEVYRMSHKLISSDTVDINFSLFTAHSKGTDLYCALHCGGTIGYHPDIRFALRKNDQVWEVIENRFSSSN